MPTAPDETLWFTFGPERLQMATTVDGHEIPALFHEPGDDFIEPWFTPFRDPDQVAHALRTGLEAVPFPSRFVLSYAPRETDALANLLAKAQAARGDPRLPKECKRAVRELLRSGLRSQYPSVKKAPGPRPLLPKPMMKEEATAIYDALLAHYQTGRATPESVVRMLRNDFVWRQTETSWWHDFRAGVKEIIRVERSPRSRLVAWRAARRTLALFLDRSMSYVRDILQEAQHRVPTKRPVKMYTRSG